MFYPIPATVKRVNENPDMTDTQLEAEERQHTQKKSPKAAPASTPTSPASTPTSPASTPTSSPPRILLSIFYSFFVLFLSLLRFYPSR